MGHSEQPEFILSRKEHYLNRYPCLFVLGLTAVMAQPPSQTKQKKIATQPKMSVDEVLAKGSALEIPRCNNE